MIYLCVMLRCAAIVMTFLILVSSVKEVAIVAHFYINQTYIADTLCINRDRPEIMCSGKCVLKDNLSESHDEESSLSTQHQVNRTIYLFPPTLSSVIPEETIDIERKPFYFTPQVYNHQHLVDIFHPPTSLS